MTDILFTGVNDWRSITQRPQHLARGLARRHRVLYVNPIGYSWLTHGLRRLRGATHRGWRPRLEAVGPGLWAFTPSPALPFSRRVRAANRVNHALLAAQLRPVLAALGFDRPALWAAFPTAVDLVGRLETSAVVFDRLDDYPGFFAGRERATIAEMERELLAVADLVLATSAPLAASSRAAREHVALVPNGVDALHFAAARLGRVPVAEDVVGLPGPRFGYVGTIARWTDVDALVALARAVPAGSVVVVGPWEVPVPAGAPANLHVFGPRAYEALPGYLAGFDVALIPFRPGPLTEAVNPVKLFEYAAAGVPIVATRTRELARYVSWCELADTPDDLVRLSLAAAERHRLGLDAERLDRAAQEAAANSWSARVEEIERLLEAVLE